MTLQNCATLNKKKLSGIAATVKIFCDGLFCLCASAFSFFLYFFYFFRERKHNTLKHPKTGHMKFFWIFVLLYPTTSCFFKFFFLHTYPLLHCLSVHCYGATWMHFCHLQKGTIENKRIHWITFNILQSNLLDYDGDICQCPESGLALFYLT